MLRPDYECVSMPAQDKDSDRSERVGGKKREWEEARKDNELKVNQAPLGPVNNETSAKPTFYFTFFLFNRIFHF